MRDSAFRTADVLPRLRGAFRDAQVVELPKAKHYFADEAPDAIAEAVLERFAGK